MTDSRVRQQIGSEGLLLADREHAGNLVEFLAGGGDTGALMRDHDWSQSPLGRPETWPQSLRSVVGLLLGSKFPMFVAWGDELGLLYNDAYAEILGKKHPAALGARFHDIWAEIWPDISPLISAAMAGEAIYREDLPLLMNRKGFDEQTWFTFSYSPVRAESGRVAGMYCAVAETTEKVVAERRQTFLVDLVDRLRDGSKEAVSAACTLLGERLAVARVGFGEVSDDATTIVIEREYTEAGAVPGLGAHRLEEFGLALVADLRGSRTLVVDDVLADPRTSSSPAAHAALGTRSIVAVPLIRDGRLRATFHLSHREPRRWTSDEVRLVEDVAERTWSAFEQARAETARAAAQDRLRAAIEASGTGTFYWDIRTNALDWDEALDRLFGLPAGETARGLDQFVAMVHPDDRALVIAACERCAAQGVDFDEEFRVVRPDGEVRNIYDRGKTFFDAGGQPAYMTGACVDITDRRHTEALLGEREERLRLAIDNADIGLWDVDLVNDLLIWPARTKAMFGISPHVPVTLQDFFDGLHPDDRETTSAAFAAAADPGARALYDVEYRTVGKEDGVIRWLAAKGRGVFDDADACVRVVGTAIDVTARKAAEEALRELNETLERRVTEEVAERARAEEALRQAQKMEAMGQLTGGVARDSNDLLTPFVGALDLLQRKGVGGEREQRLIAGAVQSAERAKTLVQRLLAFARRQPLQPIPVDIAKLVKGMGELVASTTGPQIRVVVEAPDDLPAAKADPNQLEMAILNLAVNARDAMPNGGTLRISAEATSLPLGHHSKVQPGHYICLSVADTGSGMDETTLARAIEPFFSTKGIGKGTGLGLSMVHGLASQLGGALTIRSRQGLGTNIELWLPLSSVALDTSEVTQEPTGRMTMSGTALLVDDEEIVRMSTADMLSDLGYTVIEAASGEEALRLINKGERFDLLVTDHLMPGMNGTDLALAVRSARPEVPVLLVSGYAESEGIDPGLPRLTKPFRKDDLASSLAQFFGPK